MMLPLLASCGSNALGAAPHPSGTGSGRQGLLLTRDPRPPARPRDHRGHPRTRRPERPPQSDAARPAAARHLRPPAYRGRNVIERAFNGFKHWRGLATRYDKHAIVYRGALVLAAALIWLTDLGDTS